MKYRAICGTGPTDLEQYDGAPKVKPIQRFRRDQVGARVRLLAQDRDIFKFLSVRRQRNQHDLDGAGGDG